jgi:carbamate kinase
MYVCGAESQGMIGYMIQQELYNELCRQGLSDWRVASVVTQDLVSVDDPAFQHPSKPVGPFYSEDHARKRVTEGEVWIEDAGRGWRKVVPSPKPVEIIEINSIRELANDHTTVICNGGGGVPVTRDADGALRGVEAVIDKDLGGQRLATGLGADTFMILTDVQAVATDFGKPTQKWLSRLTVQEARKYLDEGQFKKGSMCPKVEACCRFIESGGKRAIVTSLEKACVALDGKAGTMIVPA